MRASWTMEPAGASLRRLKKAFLDTGADAEPIERMLPETDFTPWQWQHNHICKGCLTRNRTA